MNLNYHHFSRWNIKFARNLYIFQIHIYPKILITINLTCWGNSNHFPKKIAKKIIEKKIIWKSYFGEKWHARLMWSNACGSFNLILTPNPFVTMSSKQFECSYKIEQGKMTMIMETKVLWILKLSPKFKGSTP
jgi:hypothetical protein